MARLRLPCALLVALAVLAQIFTRTAPGQDSADLPAVSKEEQVERIRRLPAEERRRLAEALSRFRALPSSEREALRHKARTVGIERLGELAGRDFDRLRERHAQVQRELDEIMKLVGEQRLAGLTEEERTYLRGEALRGFQGWCKSQLLSPTNLGADFKSLPPAERRARLAQAFESAFHKLLEEKSPEEKARVLALPAREQRAERDRVFAEWRMRQTFRFVKNRFEGRILGLLKKSPEERRLEIAKRVRWFQLVARLDADGVHGDAMRMLRQLGPDERATVSIAYEQALALPVAEPRARVEAKIRETYGKGALEGGRPARPLFREILRERAQRERRR